jgi:hypothetical protein
MPSSDVLVIGKGNAALCAALAARDQGASVVMLEAASEEESGGNSAFAGGVMRFAFDGVEDLKRVTDLSPEEIASSDFGTNTREEYFDDLFRLTSYRTDPELSELLVTRSLDAMAWLRGKGVRFVPNFGRQSALVNGKRRFFGRLPIEVSGGGAGRLARDYGHLDWRTYGSRLSTISPAQLSGPELNPCAARPIKGLPSVSYFTQGLLQLNTIAGE